MGEFDKIDLQIDRAIDAITVLKRSIDSADTPSALKSELKTAKVGQRIMKCNSVCSKLSPLVYFTKFTTGRSPEVCFHYFRVYFPNCRQGPACYVLVI